MQQIVQDYMLQVAKNSDLTNGLRNLRHEFLINKQTTNLKDKNS